MRYLQKLATVSRTSPQSQMNHVSHSPVENPVFQPLEGYLSTQTHPTHKDSAQHLKSPKSLQLDYI